jgi:cytoskeletal protein RodZ
MRLTRSTAVGAVAALFIGLMLSHGPWWARGSPSLASAAGTTPAAAPAPAPSTPAPDTQPPPAAPAPAPVVVPPAAAPAPAAKVPSDGIGPLTGANVTVYLRADAMGMQFTGANMEVRNLATRRGAFVRCDDQWFILKHESQEIWIPRSSIALVEMRS